MKFWLRRDEMINIKSFPYLSLGSMTREKSLSKSKGWKKYSRYLTGGMIDDLKPRCLPEGSGVGGSKGRPNRWQGVPVCLPTPPSTPSTQEDPFLSILYIETSSNEWMNFLSLKTTNQNQPTHSTDRETETQKKSRNQIQVIYLFIETAVISGCSFILCLLQEC